MTTVFNYFWDREDPTHPFTVKSWGNPLANPPENATRVAIPNYKKGTIPCWDGEKWIIKADWRQEILYDTQTGKQVTYPTVDINPDDLENTYTFHKPDSLYDEWVNGKWVLNTEKQKHANILTLNLRKKEALTQATAEIELITDSVDWLKSINEDTSEYTQLLSRWKRYRGQLGVLKITTGEETLPTPPETLEELNG